MKTIEFEVQLAMADVIAKANAIYNYCKENNLLNNQDYINYTDQLNEISVR